MPDMFKALDYGVIGRAFSDQRATLTHWHPRDFTEDTHKTVDDTPFGGGAGMVMKPEPLVRAIQAAKAQTPAETPVVYLSPAGTPLTQPIINRLAKHPALILVCGRYEGIDQRVIDKHIDASYSIGDYVLSGGELPAMVMMDAIIRQRPAVLGNENSLIDESFSEDLLGYPQYTRPAVFEEMPVPDVLLSGHHDNIARWRLKQALGKTWETRPEIIKALQNAQKLDRMRRLLLAEYIREYRKSERQS